MADGTEPPSAVPPAAVCSERVLHYAVLDETVGFNSGHRLVFIDGKELGKVPYLAICQETKASKFLIYYCDGDWGPVGASEYDTVEAAKSRAERIYPGSSAKWVEAHFTEEEVTRYLDESGPIVDAASAARDRIRASNRSSKHPATMPGFATKCVAEFSRK